MGFKRNDEGTTPQVLGYPEFITLIERKSRVPQIQGVQGRSRSKLLRVLGNAEDEVSSAFPKGIQNGAVFLEIYISLVQAL